MMASLEPVVAVPIAVADLGACHRCEIIEMQRSWTFWDDGYSSWSTRFWRELERSNGRLTLLMFSWMSFWHWSGTHV